MTPRPALALVLAFPAPSDYDEKLEAQERKKSDQNKDVKGANVMWYKQTINNACGPYAILHAVCNGDARNGILPNSHLSRLLAVCAPLSQSECARVIEEDVDLEAVYKSVAQQGDSEVPESPEDVVGFHYVCLVESHTNGRLYEVDGDKQEPVDMGTQGPGEDVLSATGLGVIRGFVQRERERAGDHFSLLVLAPQ
ncbi:uncharacterized protein APUU_50900S [Aspergillus puulaauensis]|uniref:Ubiquitin carboxyl-terminal hydrolase n=1 Tax=Aspergillus puulaauensis TaxID=1220207 RepID=A0A7R7XSX0_9EURO|nr:uncharacterized protein APUU_50900S [Aspergillus puulaauensis]BCS26189.1 hypothetical protein APUU_50900S [Aspergillus puulaauensis]